MSTKLMPSLNTLPPELIHYIFRYLDAPAIVRSLRGVCKKLYTIVKNYAQFKLNFESISKSDFLFLCNFIEYNNVVSLTLCDNESTPGQIEYFLSFVHISQFTRLRSLTLIEIEDCYLKIILRNTRNLALESLSICSEQDYTLANTTPDDISSILTASNIQKLNFSIPSFDQSNMQWPFDNKLQHLEICCRTIDDYCKILCHLPNLQTLVVNQWNEHDTDYVLPKLSNLQRIHQLFSLTFKNCSFEMIILESLLLLTPSLQHLKLLRSVELNEFLSHLQQWQKLIEKHLTVLHKFEFLITDYSPFLQPNLDIETLIAPFRGSFWTETKNWFVICDYIVRPRTIIIYTPSIYDSKLEYIYESKNIQRVTSTSTITNRVTFDGARKLTLNLATVTSLAQSQQVT